MWFENLIWHIWALICVLRTDFVIWKLICVFKTDLWFENLICVLKTDLSRSVRDLKACRTPRYNYKQLKLHENTVSYNFTRGSTRKQDNITTKIMRFNAHAHHTVNFLIPNYWQGRSFSYGCYGFGRTTFQPIKLNLLLHYIKWESRFNP